MDKSANSELLDEIISSLDLLVVKAKGQIDDLSRVKALGASCDVYTGYTRVGPHRMKVAVKKLRIYCDEEPAVAKVRVLFEYHIYLPKMMGSMILQRLVKEAYIWSKLEHRNVLPLVGFFLDDLQSPHLVSTWMEKGTLFDRLKSSAKSVDAVSMVCWFFH